MTQTFFFAGKLLFFSTLFTLGKFATDSSCLAVASDEVTDSSKNSSLASNCKTTATDNNSMEAQEKPEKEVQEIETQNSNKLDSLPATATYKLVSKTDSNKTSSTDYTEPFNDKNVYASLMKILSMLRAESEVLRRQEINFINQKLADSSLESHLDSQTANNDNDFDTSNQTWPGEHLSQILTELNLEEALKDASGRKVLLPKLKDLTAKDSSRKSAKMRYSPMLDETEATTFGPVDESSDLLPTDKLATGNMQFNQKATGKQSESVYQQTKHAKKTQTVQRSVRQPIVFGAKQVPDTSKYTRHSGEEFKALQDKFEDYQPTTILPIHSPTTTTTTSDGSLSNFGAGSEPPAIFEPPRALPFMAPLQNQFTSHSRNDCSRDRRVTQAETSRLDDSRLAPAYSVIHQLQPEIEPLATRLVSTSFQPQRPTQRSMRQSPLGLNSFLHLQSSPEMRTNQRYLTNLGLTPLKPSASSLNNRILRPQRSTFNRESDFPMSLSSQLSTIRLQQVHPKEQSVFTLTRSPAQASTSSSNNAADLQHQPQTLQIAAVPSIGFNNNPQQLLLNNAPFGIGGPNGFLDQFGRQVFVIGSPERRQTDWTIMLWLLVAAITLPVIAGAFFVPVFLKTVAFIIQTLQAVGLIVPITSMVASQLGQQLQLTGKT